MGRLSFLLYNKSVITLEYETEFMYKNYLTVLFFKTFRTIAAVPSQNVVPDSLLLENHKKKITSDGSLLSVCT